MFRGYGGDLTRAYYEYRSLREYAHGLSPDEYEEVYLYRKQTQLRAEKDARRTAYEAEVRQRKTAFEAEMQQSRRAFEEDEHVRDQNHRDAFGQIIKARGIEEARKTTVPAYSFRKFSKLPVELQAKIWSMAARVSEPQMHAFVSMKRDVVHTFDAAPPDREAYIPHGSSRLINAIYPWTSPPALALLNTCCHSRKVVEKVYTRLSVQGDPPSEAYYNTLYDSFYMGCDVWSEFKLLVDLVLKQETGRRLQRETESQLIQLYNISHLIVDLEVLAEAPVDVWTGFPRIEVLTVSFDPHRVTERFYTNDMFYDHLQPSELTVHELRKGTQLGKRADWIVERVTQGLKSENPGWEVPEIRAMIRTKTRRDPEFDWGIDLGMGPDMNWESVENQVVGSTSPMDDERDDSEWYRQAELTLARRTTKEQIEALKAKHAAFYADGEGEGESEDRGAGLRPRPRLLNVAASYDADLF